MPFPFTFSLSVPGLSNPFISSGQKPAPTPVDSFGNLSTQAPSKQQKVQITRPRPPPSPPRTSTPPVLVSTSRKRGWEPSFAPTRSTATLTSTSGYLDTPAKYREMAERNPSADEFHEVEMFADTEMPPPAKRRRGLAGSIVSTALSAALIGTAVGLTVYRLWRDRGKEAPRLEGPQQAPPPPYQQGAWTPSAPLQITPATPTTPTTPKRRRERRPITSASKRTVAHRRIRPRTPAYHTTSPKAFPSPQPEFNFDPQPMAEPTEVDDQMDWIGDKLSMLIEEGKRALSREIVISSDAKEDEVDDASGAWEEDDVLQPSASSSRAGSMRRSNKRPRSLAPSVHTFQTHHSSLSPSPTKSSFSFAQPLPSTSAPQMTSTPLQQHRGVGLGMPYEITPSTSSREDERAWESPEIRESMERARARLLRNHGS